MPHHSEKSTDKLFQADSCGRIGFADYALRNNSANIRRFEKRLAALQKAGAEETTEEKFSGGIRLIDTGSFGNVPIL